MPLRQQLEADVGPDGGVGRRHVVLHHSPDCNPESGRSVSLVPCSRCAAGPVWAWWLSVFQTLSKAKIMTNFNDSITLALHHSFDLEIPEELLPLVVASEAAMLSGFEAGHSQHRAWGE